MRRAAIFFAVLATIFILTTACGGSETSLPVVPAAVTPVASATHGPTSKSAKAIEKPSTPYYDQGSPSSVIDKEALFDYLRSVTGVFVGFQFVSAPLKTLPESFQKEYIKFLESLNKEEYALVLRQNGADSKEALFDKPVRFYLRASPGEAWGHGIIVRNKVATSSHVAGEENLVLIVESSPFKDLPRDLFSIVHAFLPLGEETVLQDQGPYTLTKIMIYSDYLLTWLAPDSTFDRDSFVRWKTLSFPEVKFGRPSELRRGTFLYVVTAEGIKEGVVGTPEQIGLSSAGNNFVVVELLNGGQFINGDSGAPVFAIREGAPYFMGFVERAKKDDYRFGVAVSSYLVFTTIPKD